MELNNKPTGKTILAAVSKPNSDGQRCAVLGKTYVRTMSADGAWSPWNLVKGNARAAQ